MAHLYQRFMRVLEKWPANEKRLSKTLGSYLREQGKIAFDKKGEFKGDHQSCERRLASLERIARGHWSAKYPRSRQSTATGLTPEQCGIAVTREAVEQFEDLMNESYIIRSYKLWRMGK